MCSIIWLTIRVHNSPKAQQFPYETTFINTLDFYLDLHQTHASIHINMNFNEDPWNIPFEISDNF